MKIIGTDYDGTLNYGGFDLEKKSAIIKWRKAGTKIGIISGRGHFFFEDVKRISGLDFDFFLAYNGGVMLDETGKMVDSVECDTVPIVPFIEQLFAWGCPFANLCSHDFYRVRPSADTLESGEFLLEGVPPLPFFYQVSVQLPTNEEAAVITDKVNAKYSENLTALLNGTCVDIVPRGVNKAFGMNRIMEYYGASYDDIITVGDNINDTDMIRAFRSYAMKSGAEAIKQLAAHVVESVTELINIEL